jgi:hypothetical protein
VELNEGNIIVSAMVGSKPSMKRGYAVQKL